MKKKGSKKNFHHLFVAEWLIVALLCFQLSTAANISIVNYYSW